jgi:hypothetical protein
MLVPGRIHQGTTIRIPVNFQNDEDEDIDPGTVTFKLISHESGAITTYVYGTDEELIKTGTGDYYVDVTPTEAGHYTYRWETTGTNQLLATEGVFVVQASPFYDNCSRGDYR